MLPSNISVIGIANPMEALFVSYMGWRDGVMEYTYEEHRDQNAIDGAVVIVFVYVCACDLGLMVGLG
jgi:hypothetical protein